MVRSIQPCCLASALCLWLSIPTNPLDHCFSSGRFKGWQKDSVLILSFPVLLPQMYEEQCATLRSQFHCQRKALLMNHLALLCCDSWTSSRQRDILFSKVQTEVRFWWVALNIVSEILLELSTFLRPIWVNHWCEEFDCRCKWLVHVTF